jgi:geranylgeranyl diphosphate synthase, type II
MFNLSNWYKIHKEPVEIELAKTFNSLGSVPPELKAAMEYSVFPGGKRLRSFLVLAAAEALRRDTTLVLPLACAMELIHSYSLVHDDLPCMDNDDLRRGQPTCHKKYGEAMALLAGNALLTLAFEVLLSGAEEKSIAPERAIAVMSQLLKASGAEGMIGGQAYELTLEAGAGEQELLKLHAMKTMALIKSAVTLPAVWLGFSDSSFKALSLYGENLGLAFQIMDDLKDTGSKDEFINYARILGKARAGKLAAELISRALESIENFEVQGQALRAIANFVVESGT